MARRHVSGRFTFLEAVQHTARSRDPAQHVPGKARQSLASVGIVVQEGQGMPDEILTLPEVAALLKVADKTVYTMAQKAEIPAFKVRGQWRFKREDIDVWIEQQKSTHFDDPKRS